MSDARADGDCSHHRVERLALDELHHDEIHVVIGADVVMVTMSG